MKRRNFFQSICGLFALPFIKTRPQPEKIVSKPEAAKRLAQILIPPTEKLRHDIIWGPDTKILHTKCGKVNSISYIINNMNSTLYGSAYLCSGDNLIKVDIPDGQYVHIGQTVNTMSINGTWEIVSVEC